jgi:aminoglycoside phosphotransferase (APT) family kinase protein
LTESKGTARPVPSLETASRLIEPAFPRDRVVGIEPLTGGLRNSSFKMRLDVRAEPIVLRLYDKDPSVCAKEVSLLRQVRDTVPVPEVLHAEPDGVDGAEPYVLLDYVEGVSFRELKRAGNVEALREAAPSVGEALAAIARYEFLAAGRLGEDMEVVGPFVEGPDPVPKFLDSCLASPHFRSRAGVELTSKVHELGWSWSEQLASLDEERRLVHGDFNSPNLLARRVGGRWRLAAVLDWEFALSGSPLFDVGNLLRYEREARPVLEPWFSRGFVEHGGRLPKDWRRLARVIDLTSLCEILSRQELPDTVAIEVTDLLRATLENRDPP